jgi:FkbM family methyltransferase
LHSFPNIFDANDCRYGRMIYPRQDMYVGRSLALYGEYSEGEAEIFKALIRPGEVVVEVGANIGAHTVLLARLAGPEGAVLAFEPQPVLFQILCANLALNGIANVRAENMGLGERAKALHIPCLDYGADDNFGGISLEFAKEGVPVRVTMLDAFGLQRCSFIKIDVERMEHQVLEGGANTIYNLRPILYVENDCKEKSPALIELLMSMEYVLWWHVTPYFNANNFTGDPGNAFVDESSLNMLCFPMEKLDSGAMRLTENMPPVEGPGSWPKNFE